MRSRRIGFCPAAIDIGSLAEMFGEGSTLDMRWLGVTGTGPIAPYTNAMPIPAQG